MSSRTFADLGVSSAATGALADRGITAPFAIQAARPPRCTRRPRRLRPGPHRLRQDPRLRPRPSWPAAVTASPPGRPASLVVVPTPASWPTGTSSP